KLALTPGWAAACSTAYWIAVLRRPGGVTAPTTASSVVTASGGGAIAAGHLASPQRNQLAAVFLGVVQRVEAANQERGDAEVVVVEERLGDLLRRADEGRRVAGSGYHSGDRRPEPLVVHLGPSREVDQTAGPYRVGKWRRAISLLRDHLREDLAGLVPGLVLGGRDDRPQRHADARRAAPLGSGRSHRGDPLADFGQRLAPQHVDVAMLRADLVGRAGSSAEVE